MFDTCGLGYFEAGKGYEPEIADLNLLLEKNRVKGIKFTKLTESDVPVASIVYELQVSGLG